MHFFLYYGTFPIVQRICSCVVLKIRKGVNGQVMAGQIRRCVQSKGGTCFGHLALTCACAKLVHSVLCSGFLCKKKCLRHGQPVTWEKNGKIEKVAPNFWGCKIVRSQYFYGILHRTMYSWKRKKTKTFCTPFVMFDKRLKTTSEECSIYL